MESSLAKRTVTIPQIHHRYSVPTHTLQFPDRLQHFFIRPTTWWKRTLDLAGSVTGLLILAPVLIAIALYIKIVSPGPAFFCQTRIGQGGKSFGCFKFRTMQPNADPTIHREYLQKLLCSGQKNSSPGDPMFKLREDPRIINGGRILRASGLDELPQLINILLGQMSLVGPRPPVPYEIEHYPTWYNSRFDVKPGLTGLWQVNGKNSLGCNEMMRLDIHYTMHSSLFLDLKILLKTPYAIIAQISATRKKAACI